MTGPTASSGEATGVGFGYVWVQYPDGSSKLFVHKAEENGEAEAVYVPYIEDGSREYVTRVTSAEINGEEWRLKKISYTLHTDDGGVLVFETDDLRPDNFTQSIYYTYGLVFWTAQASCEWQDQFGNTLEYEWARKEATSITDGVST